MNIDAEMKTSDTMGPQKELSGNEFAEKVPILPVRDMVAFPKMNVPFMISFTSAPMIESIMETDHIVGLLTVKDQDAEDPVPGQLYEVGTVARILHAKKKENGAMVALMHGMHRFKVTTWHPGNPYLMADVAYAPETVETGLELEALQRQLTETVKAVLTMIPDTPKEAIESIQRIKDPLQLAYVTALNINLPLEKRQSILEMDSVSEKMRELLLHLSREKEVLDISRRIQSEVHEKMSKSQRDYVLRQQLKAIKEELGESDATPAPEADVYANRLQDADMPEEARKEAERELERMQQMSPQSAEYPIIKTYLDWLIDLPWQTLSEESGDIAAARRILEADHYGLEDVKTRLVEYMAVRHLVRDRKPASPEQDERDEKSAMGVILCLVGPPGVGKTSLGRSVARALGREFTRMSLGGVHDEAEIRGHRRTYIGAMPGRIIQAIKRAGTRNPVFMLDEIDKVGQDWRGDPSSALLEVLDPAQNSSFRDHYLDVDFDLSEVIFIATANQLDTIPGPLRDRMEVIQLDGYTALEKLEIAKRHLVPRQLAAHRLKDEEVTFMQDALLKIIHDYTREAGVRNLERHIAAICRKSIVQLSENGWSHVLVTTKMVRDYLKKERFESEQTEPITLPGIATGLAVTSVGGDILYIEASRMPGKGRLSLTGQLGAVMKESAEIAFSYVRSKADRFGIDAAVFEKSDVHVHVPAGALPKDGPSAGVAMTMALVSLFSGRPVRGDVGITGEITLRGRVLPVGGIKMKALAAHRAGLKTVVLPKRNQKDLAELPEEVLAEVAFVMVDQIDEAITTHSMTRR
ncbi:endopeptidase La [Desulfosarcina cetonica]|uniref:endopeptidase La n=1 Tax=Desulfosarcina cetonica TaxID=90730 RepID=UPI0009F98770|nr:endopeptidase La [Desulfosarcina cetonica]